MRRSAVAALVLAAAAATLITARVAHAYARAGTYTVAVHAASRCARPAGGGGTEEEFDVTARLTITVTG